MTPLMVSDAQVLFTDRMAVLYPGMPLVFENTNVADLTGYYAVFHVMPGESMPLCLGVNAKSRNVGMIQIDVVGPLEKGRKEAFNRAYAAGRIFRRQVRTIGVEGQVTYKDPYTRSMGEQNGKHVEMTRIEYRYDYSG